MAIGMIQDICREAELDRIYVGKVKSIKEFGAFVEIIPGNEGLLHISQIAESRIRAVGDVLSEGDIVAVKVIEIDGNGKMRLSPQGGAARPARDRRAGEAQDRARRARRRCLVAYRKSALPNGIRLVTETMPHVRSVAVGIWVETGSRREPEALGGISHLIEHLVFKGTAHALRRGDRPRDRLGGRPDGRVHRQGAHLLLREVLDEHLPLAVDLLTDILRHPLFAAERHREGEGGRPPGDQDGGGHPGRPHPRPVRGAGLGRTTRSGGRSSGRWDVVKGFDRDTVLGYFEREYVPGRDRGRGGRQRRARAGGRSLRGRLRGLGAAGRAARGSPRPRSTPASTSCRSRSSRCTS